MEEKLNNNQQPKMQEPSVKNKNKKVKIAVITLCTVGVLLLGFQVYASTNGYGNVFFMIKNLITTGNPAGNQEISSDKDITLSNKTITEKDKVSTKIEEENENIFEDASKLNYTSNFKDSQNGKIAVLKLGENEFKTSQKDGYYIYTDMFNNSYYIKNISNIESKFEMTSSDNKNALFCCTIYYIDNNNVEKNFDLAVILSSDFSNTTIMGNYLSYTGSTSFTRFVGIYNEGNDTNDSNTEHYSKDEIMNTANWVQVWPDIGMKFKIPKNFEQGQVNEKNNLLSVEFTGWIVTQNNEGEPVKIKCYNELNKEIEDVWDVLEYNVDRTVKSTDNKYWTDWYPLKNDEDINSPENGYIRRSYGRVRDDQIQKIIFDIKADSGIDVEHYTFIRNVLESVISTSR